MNTQTHKIMYVPLVIAGIAILLFGIVAMTIVPIMGWLHSSFGQLHGLAAQVQMSAAQAALVPVVPAAEEGQPVSDLRDFLTAKSDEPLPQTVDTFLADLEARIGQLSDCGPSRLLECKDATVAALLASDRRLGKLCLPAGERHLVFRTADEAAFRRGLRELGYTFPSER